MPPVHSCMDMSDIRNNRTALYPESYESCSHCRSIPVLVRKDSRLMNAATERERVKRMSANPRLARNPTMQLSAHRHGLHMVYRAECSLWCTAAS